jgi:hypothetical protein
VLVGIARGATRDDGGAREHAAFDDHVVRAATATDDDHLEPPHRDRGVR